MITAPLHRRLDAAAAALAARATPGQVARNGVSRIYRSLEYYRDRRRAGDDRGAAEALCGVAALALALAGQIDPGGSTDTQPSEVL